MAAAKRTGSMPKETTTAADVPEETPAEVEPEPEENVTEDAESEDDPTAEEESVGYDDAVPLEDMDPEEDLWPDGPKIGQVVKWKEEHGEVWVTTLNPYTNNHVLWRPLDRHEYRGLVAGLEASVASGTSQAIATMDNEEMVTEIVTLFPPFNRHNRKGMHAGLPQTIAQEVMEMSGFVAVEVRQL